MICRQSSSASIVCPPSQVLRITLIAWIGVAYVKSCSLSSSALSREGHCSVGRAILERTASNSRGPSRSVVVAGPQFSYALGSPICTRFQDHPTILCAPKRVCQFVSSLYALSAGLSHTRLPPGQQPVHDSSRPLARGPSTCLLCESVKIRILDPKSGLLILLVAGLCMGPSNHWVCRAAAPM